MADKNTFNKGVMLGNLLDESGYAAQKQLHDDADKLKEGGVLGEIELAARNSALGTWGVTIGNKLLIGREDLPEDPKFKAGLFERIRTDLPDVTDTEQSQIMGAGNIHEYNLLMKTAQRRRTEQRLASQSGLATGLEVALDIMPELAIGLRLSGALTKVASGGRRAALAIGGNAVAGGAYEAGRQRASLEETSGADVAFASILSGVAGGLFDTGLKYGQMATKTRQIAKDKLAELVLGGKPAADNVADDVVETATKAADEAVVPTGNQVDELQTPKVDPVEYPALKGIMEEITETAPKQVEALDALLDAARRINRDEAGPMQKAFLDAQEAAAAREEAYWAKYQEDGMADLNARLKQDELNRAARNSAESARVDDVLKDLEAVPVKTEAEKAWDDAMATTSRVSTAEGQASKAMTEGRLRLKVGSKHSKPIFESPVDRALATLGSHVTDDDLLLDALDTLKRAFPGEENDTLVSMASDYVDTMLMPHLRNSKSGAPNVARTWDKLDAAAFRDGYVENSKALAEVAQAIATPQAPLVAELLTRHADDVDGSLLEAAVAKANKSVTNQTMGSNFTFLQKSNKVLADTMNARIAAHTAEAGVAPDLRTVRQWMAKEMYNRSLFDKQAATRGGKAGKQGGFIQLKMLFVLPSAVVLTAAMTNDAEAATGAAASSGTLSGILATGAMVLGGKPLMKVLAARGAASKAVAANLDKAKKLAKKGETSDAIEAATGFRQVDSEWHLKVDPAKFPEIAAEAKLTSENLDEVLSTAKGFTLNGEPVKVMTHYDEEKVINTLADLDKAPPIKAEVKVFGKKMHVKTPAVVSGDSTEVARDPSVVMRGLGMLLMSNIIPRLGRKATEMAADHLFKSIKTAALGRADVAFKKNLGDWYAETGAKRPLNPVKGMQDQERFGIEIARAKEFPEDAGVSKAAKAVAAELAAIEAETIGRFKKLVEQMQARGVVFKDNNPLYMASQVDPQANYVSRLVSKKNMDALEARIGREGVLSLIKDAFASANGDVPADKLNGIAQGIYETFLRIHDNTGVYIPKDQAANFIEKLRAQGLDDDTIGTVGNAFGIRESNRGPGVTKERHMEVNLQVSKTFNVNGEQVTVRMEDLYERNAMTLFSRWTNSMAGLEALGTAGAQHGLNLTDDNLWKMLMAKGSSQGADAKTIKALNAYRDLLMGQGRDVDYFGVASTTERTIRTLATFWLGSNFVLAQAGDLGGMGTASLKKLSIKGVKAAHELRKAIEDGTMELGELTSLASWMDLGLDSVSASVANAAETTSDVGATLLEQAGHWQAKLTGMNIVTNAVAALRGHELTQFLVAHAMGEAVDEKMWKHYATFGLDKAVADGLAPMVRKHMVFDPETGLFKGIDKKGWQAEDLLGARRLEMALKKAAHSANSQAAGTGETAAFFRSTLAGRFLGQLQSSAYFATQRTLGEVYNFDAHVMNAWLTSMAFASGSYMLRVGMRYMGDEEELEKRLTYEQIFLASIRNSSFAGLGPSVIDTMLHYSGVMPGGLFDGASAGAKGGGELAVQGAIKTPLTAVAGLMGLAKFDPYNAYTQQEAMALQRTLAPLWWMQPMMTFATQDMATKNPKRPPEDPDASPFN